MRVRARCLSLAYAAALASLAGHRLFAGELPRADLSDPELRGRLVCLWRAAGQGTLPLEGAAWVVDQGGGALGLVAWPSAVGSHRSAWRGEVPAGALAVVHTHPRGDGPRPSVHDVAAARALSLPITVVTRAGLFTARPNGDVVREADGSWIEDAGSVDCGAAPRRTLPAPVGALANASPR